MLRALCVSSALICPINALAEPMTLVGTMSAGATDRDGGPLIGLVDLTASMPLSSDLPLSAEIGTYLFALDGKRPHETYLSLVYNDEWRFGAVRPAYDSVLPSAFTRPAPFLAYERAEYTRAFTTVRAMRATAVPLSVSWQRSFGQTDIAITAHHADKGDFRSASASIRHRGDGWSVAAAVEPVKSLKGSEIKTNAKIGGRFDIGHGNFGVALLRPEANNRPDALSLDMVLPVSDELDVLLLGEFTESALDDAYGLAMSYQLPPNSSVFVAATDGEAGHALHLTLETSF